MDIDTFMCNITNRKEKNLHFSSHVTSEKVLDSCALVFLKTVLYLYGPKSNVPSSSDAIGGIYLMKITVSCIYTLLMYCCFMGFI